LTAGKPARPTGDEARTIHQYVAAGRERLRRAGISRAEADLDARLLAEHLLGWDAAQFFASADEPPPPEFPARYASLVAERAGRAPTAYIVGRREFWHLELEVSPAVLVPRPETELIVEVALELFPDESTDLNVIDVCTGSGCLAIALAVERPRARVTATDISEAALEVARRNARRHSVADRVRFVRADLFGDAADVCDLVVANPPYVPERARRSLQPEVRDHEPAVALFAEDEGLGVIRRLVEKTGSRLRSGGYLVFEFGYGQDEDVEQLVSSSHQLELIGLRRDLQGIARAAVVRRR
jgi:release factor glutamine methyltransferase